MDKSQSVKVAVRIRPLQETDLEQDSNLCVSAIRRDNQIVAGADTVFTFDNVFDHNTQQAQIYEECVKDLVNATFEGFNATILAYGQTGSGKTWTMGSASDSSIRDENFGIIPRVINNFFEMIQEKEELDGCSTYKVHVQFLEIYGEDVRDLLDHTKTAKVTIRETAEGELFISGAKEEYVGSFEQMMKTLEDGTKNRSTAATKMNLTSSRSHAIFTVFLEHTLHSDPAMAQAAGTSLSVVASASSPEAGKKEVRKSKFHFVDLAGSERAKRTGAEGKQLKEGININQGLLALGNVISALGDEKKRGKVFVPYRDSKLTRMLQDSLGGNSKTLMICCVSPALSNLTESINALRYANRARNIQNKPVVNRDPTLVVIDGLKKILRVVASELYDVRVGRKYVEVENGVSNDLLSLISSQGVANAEVPFIVDDLDCAGAKGIGDGSGGSNTLGRANGPGLEAVMAARDAAAAAAAVDSTGTSIVTRREDVGKGIGSAGMGLGRAGSGGDRVERTTLKLLKKAQHDLELTQGRLKDAEFEVKRLSERSKTAKIRESSDQEQLLLLTSERDYYRMKWSEASPEESHALQKALSTVTPGNTETPAAHEGDVTGETGALMAKEMRDTMSVVGGYLNEIKVLKQKVAEMESTSRQQREELDGASFSPPSDEEFTTSIAVLIEQTKQQLQDETARLKRVDSATSRLQPTGGGMATALKEAGDAGGSGEDSDELSDEDKEKMSGEQLQDVEDQERDFHRRTQVMEGEVSELGQSILMKEQLVAQLARSQHQYGAMKDFYEQKLASLTSKVNEKQEERDTLLEELSSLQEAHKQQEATAVVQARELQLKRALVKKDDELRSLRKKQDELNSLSQVQSRYNTQVSKLEADILSMKRQRVDLSKSLQVEKKNHLLMLNSKAKEIAKLKKELARSALEKNRLGRGKDLAESRMREALRRQHSGSGAGNSAGGGSGATTSSSKFPLSSASYSAKSGGVSAGIADGGMHRDETGMTKDSVRNVSKLTRHGSGSQLPSQRELQMKKWISRRVTELNIRENAAEGLKRACDSQMALLNQKAALEEDKRLLEAGNGSTNEQGKLMKVKNSLTNIDTQLASHAHRIGIMQQQLKSLAAAETSPSTASDRSSMDQGDVVLDRFSPSLLPSDGMGMAVGDKKADIGSGKHERVGPGGSYTSNTTLEALKKSAAASLPSAHELIRILWDMLVGSQKGSSGYQLQVTELSEKVKQMKRDVDEGAARLASQKRAHDQELTKRAAEYEEKLFNAFAQLADNDATWHEDEEEEEEKQESTDEKSRSAASFRNTLASATTLSSGLKHTVISADEYRFMKDKLQRDSMKLIEMQFRVADAEDSRQALAEEIEQKNVQIKFLEEDRATFKEMVDDLKNGLYQLGRPGKVVLESLKEKSFNRHKSVPNLGAGSQFAALSSTTYDDIISEDSDNESMGDGFIDAFETLADDINRTGTAVASTVVPPGSVTAGAGTGTVAATTVPMPDTPLGQSGPLPSPPPQASSSTVVPPGPGTAGNSGSSSSSSSSSGSTTKPVVYDRLTNPTYFTGHMKKVFDTEVETKRKRVLQTRIMEKAASQTHNINVLSASGSVAVNGTAGNVLSAGTVGSGSTGAVVGSGSGTMMGTGSSGPIMAASTGVGTHSGTTAGVTTGTTSVFESMGMRKSLSASAASPRSPAYLSGLGGGGGGTGLHDDIALPPSAQQGGVTGATESTEPQPRNVFARLAGRTTATAAAKSRVGNPLASKDGNSMAGTTSTNASGSSGGAFSNATATQSSNNDENSSVGNAGGSVPLNARTRNRDKEKERERDREKDKEKERDASPSTSASPNPTVASSVYAKKAEVFMAAINSRSTPPIVTSESVDHSDGAESGGGSGAVTGAMSLSHVPSRKPPGSGSITADAAASAATETTNATTTAARGSSNSSGARGASVSVSVPGSDFHTSLSSQSSEELLSMSPPSMASSAGVGPGSATGPRSLRKQQSKERWSTAGTGRWHRVPNPSLEAGADSASNLRHLQDELQKAVNDLGALVGSESHSNPVSPAPSGDARDDHRHALTTSDVGQAAAPSIAMGGETTIDTDALAFGIAAGDNISNVSSGNIAIATSGAHTSTSNAS